ncbi:MAG: SpoIIE family protein phosphatase [Candidatus Riflebacteria bacterium]|nr:SpoIIE family protein phosphatase [Candidatus Riflebacteria bacterium]
MKQKSQKKDRSTSPYFRFVIFSFIFCIVPFLVSGFLGWYYLENENEVNQNKALESIKNSLNDLVCQIDPEYYINTRFNSLHRQIFSRPVTPERLTSFSKSAKQQWGFDFDLYCFDQNGKLLTPENVKLRSRFLISRLWDAIATNWIYPGDLQKRGQVYQAYRKSLNAIKGLFGKEFIGSLIANRLGESYRFYCSGRSGLIFWNINMPAMNGGTICIVWDIPSPEKLISQLFSKSLNYPIQTAIRDSSDNNIYTDKRLTPDRASRLWRLLEDQQQDYVIDNDFIWVMLKSSTAKIIAGKQLKSVFSREFVLTAVAIWIFGFTLLLTLIFRWIIQRKSFYMPIPAKLVALFLYAVFLPTISILFLAYLSIRDGRAAMISDCQKNAREALLDLDSSFNDEKNRLLQYVRNICAEPKLRQDPKKVLEELVSDNWNMDKIDFKLINLNGSEILSSSGADNVSSALIRAFSGVCIEKYLSERLATENEGKIRRPDFQAEMIFDTPEVGLQKLVEQPDVLHTVQLTSHKNIWYWDVFKEPNHPAAFIFFNKKYELLVKKYLSRAIIRSRKSFQHGKFRIFAKIDDSAIWYPGSEEVSSQLAGLANRAKIQQVDFFAQVKISGQSYLAAVHPGKNVSGVSFMALFPVNEIERHLTSIKEWVFSVVIFIFFTTVFIGIALSDTFLIPVSELKRGMQALESRQLDLRLLPQAKDELGDLTNVFNQMMGSLEESSMGKVVQERLFPTTTLEAGNYRVFGQSKPASDLGGDYFDYMLVDENRFIVILGDVTGHGIPAALVMAMAKSVILVGMQKNLELEEIFILLNTTIFKTMRKKLFMTCCVAEINIQTNIIRIINFGQTYPILLTNDAKFTMVKTQPSLPLGMREKLRFTLNEFQMQPNEKMIFYTDGLIESMPESSEIDSFIQFSDYLIRLNNEKIDKFCNKIIFEHPFFKTNEPQPDDFTAVVLERTSA